MKGEEHIWVDKEFAEIWKKLQSEEATRDQQEAVFNEYIAKMNKSIRRDFECNLEGIEEDAAVFTGLMLKVKQAFEKAKNEHLTSSYALWEKFEDEIPSTRKKVESIVETLKPLESQLNAINDLIGKINTWNINELIKSINDLAGAYGAQKEMVEFLVKNFKRPE